MNFLKNIYELELIYDLLSMTSISGYFLFNLLVTILSIQTHTKTSLFSLPFTHFTSSSSFVSYFSFSSISFSSSFPSSCFSVSSFHFTSSSNTSIYFLSISISIDLIVSRFIMGSSKWISFGIFLVSFSSSFSLVSLSFSS